MKILNLKFIDFVLKKKKKGRGQREFSSRIEWITEALHE